MGCVGTVVSGSRCVYNGFRSMDKNTKTRPFLKWAGNKYRILDRILPRLPQGRRLIEPFVGSGAVFLNSGYDRHLLNDSNADLVHLYKTLQTHGPEFIEYAGSFFTKRNNSSTVYYRLRERFNATRDIWLKSALFIYLNRHGYNGLCRYNASGEFNVPFGRYKQPYFPGREMLAFHAKARTARFSTRPFTKIMDRAREGDVVYCDPPYVPLTPTANFTGYSAGSFGLAEQGELARQAQELAARGVTVLISNHDTGFTQRAYRRAEIICFPVQRNISCNGAKRERAAELLALFS